MPRVKPDLSEDMRPPCDTSLIILQSALDRDDGTLLPLRPHDTARTDKAVAKVPRRKWVKEIPIRCVTAPAWRTPRGKDAQTLIITEVGLDALNLKH